MTLSLLSVSLINNAERLDPCVIDSDDVCQPNITDEFEISEMSLNNL